MSVTSPTSNTATTPTNAYGTATSASSTLNQADFLNLLSEQLENQDPTNPESNTDFAAQMAQFSSLTATNNMSTTLTGMAGVSQLSSGAELIGATVTTSAADSSGNAISGVVSSASVSSTTGAMTLNIGGYQVPITDVTGIAPTKS